jgi:hypothetical protein
MDPVLVELGRLLGEKVRLLRADPRRDRFQFRSRANDSLSSIRATTRPSTHIFADRLWLRVSRSDAVLQRYIEFDISPRMIEAARSFMPGH